ncbi:glycine-rich cell wall structural protein 1.8-like [Chenopodium quinoa]|uniref:Uncharacterized protein n=1 Tax=Chenopodium quinoa TaxID=63459 RepID=A0A803LII1_CHEQI|nr:glycine-rich cell wall structural protein 1.8-like [Chenopodium quinoa]XP_021756124.1 glycine-rich cell wall structural protein 1.8-like [Chenopodium quinoa]
MAGRQTERHTGNTGQGGGLGAPGTTGAYGARDPLGAPGSTGASRTTAGAPGYDPTGYGNEYGSEDMGQQQQLRRPAADDVGTGTGTGYTYGTAGSMGPTATGYHAGVHVPHTTGLSGTYGTSGGFDTGGFGKSGGGVGEGFDTGMGERTHGMGRERGGGGNPVMQSETVVIESVGGLEGQDIGDQMDEWAQSIGAGERGRNHGGNDTGGDKQRAGQRRG